MKRIITTSAFSVVFGLIATTVWLLITPVPALASQCTAKCGSGTVVCQTQERGESCTAQDGVGCTVYSSGGSIVLDNPCSGVDSICRKTHRGIVMLGKAAILMLVTLLYSTGDVYCQDRNLEAQQDSHQRAVVSLDDLPSRIKSVDEAALRILLRMEIARFLWQIEQKERNPKAEAIITEAVADLETHKKEMPAWYAKIFYRDILALLHIHSPSLLKHLNEQKKLLLPSDSSSYELTFALLDANEPGKAAEAMKRVISNGADLDFTSITALSRFASASVKELSGVLEAMLNIAESRPDAYSLNTLAQLNSFVRGGVIINGVRPQEKVPDSLKARWIRFVVSRINVLHTMDAWRGSADARFAYGLLTSLSQDIERLEPELFPIVTALLPTIREYLPKDTADNIDSRAKLDQGEDSFSERLKKQM